MVKLDMALYGANVYVVLLTFLLTAFIWVDQSLLKGPHFDTLYGYLPLWVSFVAVLANVFIFLAAMLLEKVTSKKVYAYLILFPVYLVSWWPITFYAFFTQNNKQWSHTQHTRVVRLEEVQSKQG